MAEFVIWCWAYQNKTNESSEDDVEELCGRIFDTVFDDSADGKVDVIEFIQGLDRTKSELSYDEKHELFKEADRNHDGIIDREEFIRMMTKYCRDDD